MDVIANRLVQFFGSAPATLPSGKLVSTALVLTVSLLLIYVYVIWLSPTFDYLGFPMHTGGDQVVWLALALVTFSALSLPVKLRCFSDYFLWMMFYFIYLPAMLYVPMQGIATDGGLWLVSSLAASFAVIMRVARFQIPTSACRCSRAAFIGVFFALYLLLNLYVAYVYGSALHFVQYTDVYEQRDLSDEVASGSFAGYACGFLSGAFNPFLMAVGLTEHRRTWLVLGFVGQMLMYSTAALKFILVSALLMPLLYYFHIRRPHISSTRLGVLVCVSCLIPLAIIPALGDPEGLSWQVVAIIFMRTYGMAGALTGVYSGFFADHPLTYYSHIHAVGQFVHYPYQASIGQEVGFDMSGGPLNANANFWATDGIAAAGNAGVVLIGLFVGGSLALCNGMVRPEKRRLAFVASIPFIMQIANSSFFTSLLTGGGMFVFIMIYIWQGTFVSSSNTSA